MDDLTAEPDLLEFSFDSAIADAPAAALQRLVRRSAAFNASMGLTGRLRREGERFFGVLEGRAAILLPLAGRILADPRHRAIRVTTLGALAARRFTDWAATGFEIEVASVDASNLRFMPTPVEQRRVVSAAILSLRTTSPFTALRDA